MPACLLSLIWLLMPACNSLTENHQTTPESFDASMACLSLQFACSDLGQTSHHQQHGVHATECCDGSCRTNCDSVSCTPDRRSLVFPAWHVLLADGQVGIAKAGYGPDLPVHPPSGTPAALTA